MNSFDSWKEAYRAIQDNFRENLRLAGHNECNVKYSAYDSDENDIPVDNLDDVFAYGAYVVEVKGNDFFGNGASYTSDVIINPRWKDLAVCANESVDVTGDRQHYFFEGATVARVGNPGVIRLHFGS